MKRMSRIVVQSALEIKGLGKNIGHEGEQLLRGNIYLNNKRVGWAAEGDWGGNMTIHILPQAREAVEAEAKKVFSQTPQPYSYDLETVIAELLYQKQYESDLKRSKTKKAVYDIDMTNNRFILPFSLDQAILPSPENLVQVGAINEKDIPNLKGCSMYLLDGKRKFIKLYYVY